MSAYRQLAGLAHRAIVCLALIRNGDKLVEEHKEILLDPLNVSVTLEFIGLTKFNLSYCFDWFLWLWFRIVSL